MSEAIKLAFKYDDWYSFVKILDSVREGTKNVSVDKKALNSLLNDQRILIEELKKLDKLVDYEMGPKNG